MTIILQLLLYYIYYTNILNFELLGVISALAFVRKLYNKYCFNNYINFEIGTSKTIMLFKTFHIRTLTLQVNDLEPMGTLEKLLHLVL